MPRVLMTESEARHQAAECERRWPECGPHTLVCAERALSRVEAKYG